MAKSIKKQQDISSRGQGNDLSIPEQPVKRAGKTSLSVWAMIIGWPAMLIFTFHACTHMVAAGDTWVAMACGRHFVNHGVDTVEPFSANSHKPGPTEEEIQNWPNWARWITDKVGLETVKKWHPTGWINQNWLTHVIFYKLIPKSSYADGVSFTSNALVYWKFALYIITVVCVYYTSRLLGVHPALSAFFSSFAMFIGRSFLDVRPAGFSNMLVAVFLFILVLTTYRNVLYIWLVVPVSVFWCNVHGGYIYIFIMLIPFIGLHLLTALNRKWTAILYNIAAWPFLIFVFSKASLTVSTLLFAVLLIVFDIILIAYKDNLVSISIKGVYHTIAAAVVAFVAVIVFNPFHLTNLTHTFVISVSEHAARWREIHEWQSAFDWDNPVGTAVPFLVLLILAWLVFAVWAFIYIRAAMTVRRLPKRVSKSADLYQSPRIDISLIFIAALTIYMAVRSRRFIPIAAIAGCPVVAMLIDQMIRALSAMANYRRQNRMVVPAMSRNLQRYFIIAGACAVVFFGTWWGMKFKRIYLAPWPNDAKYNSMFMRMTASDAKPFYAMKFIRDNKLSGKMLNYWTEGGFIAWGQDPDPNSGQTPLRLFMDGRAQAAYDRKAFDLWSYIMSGGPITFEILQRTQYRGQSPTSEDYSEIGRWMNEQLIKYGVWLVMMPSAVYNDPDKNNYYHAIRGLENDPNWPLVFFNNEQRIYVNMTTPRGRDIFEGIFTGKTIYPDDFHENLIRAHTWLMYYREVDKKKQGLQYAIDAFNANPSSAPILEIILLAARFSELRADIDKFCTDYLQRFKTNSEDWLKHDGYRPKIEAARLAAYHLELEAQSRRNSKLADAYAALQVELVDQLVKLTIGMKW